jgi:uncharacterized membrane protein
MNIDTAVAIGSLILLAVVVQVTPVITRPGIFFGATVDRGFPETSAGRRVLRSYRWQMALWGIAAVLVAALLMPQHPVLAIVIPFLGLMTSAGVSYWLKFCEVHSRFGIRRPEIREASLSSRSQKPAVSLWLALPPFLAVAITALYLHSHWNQFPERIPIRWNGKGQPIGWARHDAMGVYGDLLLGCLLNLFVLGLTWMLSRLPRKTVMRHVTGRSLQLLLYPLTLTFIVVALLPLMRAPIFGAPGLILACVGMIVMVTFGLVYWSYLQISSSTHQDESPDPQNDAYWKAGAFYYNPNDPAIFVSKRVGVGYTLNVANKWSWVAMGAIFLAIAALIYVAAHIAS